MDLERIYQTLCLSADPKAALERMGDGTLSALVIHLEGAGILSGIPGIILGLAENEAARRFVAANLNNLSPVGEG